jgi:predicted methyltransferase
LPSFSVSRFKKLQVHGNPGDDMMTSRWWFWLIGISIAGLSSTATGTEDSPTTAKLKAAVAMEHRSEENRERDENRSPVEAMQFCRLSDDMTVIEFGPGSGWYTEILGPVLREKGKLVIAYKDSWMEKLDPLLAQDFMSAVRKHPVDISWNSEAKRFDVGEIVYDLTDADLALNIREYHNLGPDGAKRLNEATYKALKPGGYYCIIDHTRRHMEPRNTENRRRSDPVALILEVQAAGFRLVDFSDLFFRPDDELRYEVGRKTVTGNTDRFALLFQKEAD